MLEERRPAFDIGFADDMAVFVTGKVGLIFIFKILENYNIIFLLALNFRKRIEVVVLYRK